MELYPQNMEVLFVGDPSDLWLDVQLCLQKAPLLDPWDPSFSPVLLLPLYCQVFPNSQEQLAGTSRDCRGEEGLGNIKDTTCSHQCTRTIAEIYTTV